MTSRRRRPPLDDKSRRAAANYIAAVRPHARPGLLHWLDPQRDSDGRDYN
ncbi:hypothetical protein HCJ99_19480, partial [Streptomyces sp. C1-2]|nr:hypothetical protein [Streptomyces sp. C1-2]